MDDGHQDPSVAKTLSIVVADAARGFGNGRCIPAGPLREPAATSLARAQALLTIGDKTAQDRFAASLAHDPRAGAHDRQAGAAGEQAWTGRGFGSWPLRALGIPESSLPR